MESCTVVSLRLSRGTSILIKQTFEENTRVARLTILKAAIQRKLSKIYVEVLDEFRRRSIQAKESCHSKKVFRL